MSLFISILLTVVFAAAAPAEEAALAVVQKVSGTVGFYDASGKHLKDVKVHEHPHEGILSANGRYLYVTNNGILWMDNPGEGGNTISVLDVKAMKSVGEIDLGEYRRPHGLDLDPKTGRLVVTIENPDGLLLIDANKRKVLRKYDVKGEDPHMVLFGPKAEYAWVSNTLSGTVAVVNLESGKVKIIPTGARPQGGVLSHDGKLIYLTNSDGNAIAILDTARQEQIASIPTGKGPGRIELTPDGKTLVYCLGMDEAVGFADIASRKETAQIPLGGRPLSLTMSEDGQEAYAGVQDADKVFVISVPERKILRVIQTPKGSGPDPAIPLPANH